MIATQQQQSLPPTQRSLKDSFSCIGVGLHTGLKIIMSVLPAEANTGYRFIRRDVTTGRSEIIAAWHNVTDTHLTVTVSNNFGTRVSAVEHIIAALYAYHIDNAIIVLDGPEVPAMDGSAQVFVQMIESVGVETLTEARKAIRLKRSISVKDGDKIATFTPASHLSIRMHIDFSHKTINAQTFDLDFTTENFKSEIASARNFGFDAQIKTLQQLGFIRGSKLHNSVFMNSKGVMNKEGFRFEDECVRHKMLDCIGDLALAGAPIIGRFEGNFTGHKINNALLNEIMFNHDSYDYITLHKRKSVLLDEQAVNS